MNRRHTAPYITDVVSTIHEHASAEHPRPSATEFVKKLFKLLESKQTNVVSWTADGDCFEIKDMDIFTSSILPRLFQHRNFASFVRQLNKYGFRKVKASDSNLFGENSWVFRHPDFRAGGSSRLANMKPRTSQKNTCPLNPSSSGEEKPGIDVFALQDQLRALSFAHDHTLSYLRHLERSYQAIIGEIDGVRCCVAQMQGMRNYLRPEETYAHASQGNMHECFAEDSSVLPQSPYTDADLDAVVLPSPMYSVILDTAARPWAPGSSPEPPSLGVRRWASLPEWSVPPRVLLVDDDAMIRQLGKRFLQLLGCAADEAVDGVGAIAKMNAEKYDLVLMDIDMPQLDGASATSLIRTFDATTPIISVTSSTKPTEIMGYLSSGMNDIVEKPFTKEALLEMLKKHLSHLLCYNLNS